MGRARRRHGIWAAFVAGIAAHAVAAAVVEPEPQPEPAAVAVAEPVAVAAAAACPVAIPQPVVAIDDDRVRLSTDGGGSFTDVLERPGAVDSVAFDCFGRLFVVRDGDQLGVWTGAAEAWRTLDGFATAPDLIADGARMTAVGPADDQPEIERTGYSDDGGASWRYRDRWP